MSETTKGELLYETQGRLYLLFSKYCCWKCENSSPILALGCVMKSHPILNDFEGSEFVFMKVGTMPNPISDYLKLSFPQFYKDYSRTQNETYYMNHCEHCGAKFGAHFTQEPTSRGGFFPTTIEEAAQILVRETSFFMTYQVRTIEDEYSGSFTGWDCDYFLGNELIWEHAKGSPLRHGAFFHEPVTTGFDESNKR